MNPAIVSKCGTDEIAIKEMANCNMNGNFTFEVAILHALSKCYKVAKMFGYSESPRQAIIMKFYVKNLMTELANHSVINTPLINYKIAIDLALALSFIHKRNILHLDIKPGKSTFIQGRLS